MVDAFSTSDVVNDPELMDGSEAAESDWEDIASLGENCW